MLKIKIHYWNKTFMVLIIQLDDDFHYKIMLTTFL